VCFDVCLMFILCVVALCCVCCVSCVLIRRLFIVYSLSVLIVSWFKHVLCLHLCVLLCIMSLLFLNYSVYLVRLQYVLSYVVFTFLL